MNENFIGFEKNIFYECIKNETSILEQDKKVLLKQYDDCVHYIEVTEKGFYDNICISKECSKLQCNDFTFGSVYIEFEKSKSALSMEVFVQNGYIKLIEFYSYSEQWDGRITNYNIFLVSDNGELSFLKKVNVSN